MSSSVWRGDLDGTPSGNFGGFGEPVVGVFANTVPGKRWCVCSPVTIAPPFGSNRQMRLTSAFGPPASSQGNQKLYDAPISDLLMCTGIWSAGKTYRRVGLLSVGSRPASSNA